MEKIVIFIKNFDIKNKLIINISPNKMNEKEEYENNNDKQYYKDEYKNQKDKYNNEKDKYNNEKDKDDNEIEDFENNKININEEINNKKEYINPFLSLKEKGYIIIKNFYSVEVINKMRKIIFNEMILKKNMYSFSDRSGSKPDFINDRSYKKLLPFIRFNDIYKIMQCIFNGLFRFCSHNDIGINRIVDWHKDTLNNQYKKYQRTNIWTELENGEKHEIYKVLIYLQDHSKNNDGLMLIEDSHLIPNIYIDHNKLKQIHSNLGDIIIFDQRITHRGQQLMNSLPDRILISLGFGKNNIFTDEFEEGTIQRQNDQNKIIFDRLKKKN